MKRLIIALLTVAVTGCSAETVGTADALIDSGTDLVGAADGVDADTDDTSADAASDVPGDAPSEVADDIDAGPNPCSPNPCQELNKTSCVDVAGKAECRCDAGYHALGEQCVVDESCGDESCWGHGQCDDTGGIVTCVCDPGYAGAACDECAPIGYHKDGDQCVADESCDTDSCLGHGTCDDADGVIVCDCEPAYVGAMCEACANGYHLAEELCVLDEICAPDSCSGNGTCSVVDDALSCVCNTGYLGDTCDECDAASGFHDDGAGGCTDDVCLPNPCGDANKTQCSIVEAAAVCGCDDGYHDDGAGGCTDDPCTPNPCVEPNTSVCSAGGGAAICGCDAGYHDSVNGCEPDVACGPNTCSGQGTCEDGSGIPTCACDPGYQGTACAECDAGYHPDGAGGCTTDPCTPNPCSVPNKTTCSGDAEATCECDPGYHDDGEGGCTNDPCVPNPCSEANKTQCADAGGSALCSCDDGYHDDNGTCVVDQACAPQSCAGNGTCSDNTGVVICQCDAGWAGAACDACDTDDGYHPDGAGGCTDDPCVPSPCTDTFKTVCVSSGDVATCECEGGYHDDGAGGCVVDEDCVAASCSSHGTCDDSGGVLTCTCDPGYVGASCGQCDTAAGYHDDGAGGCTTDPCMPNPCTGSFETVCNDVSGVATCSCDAGYHVDGGSCVLDETCTPTSCNGHGTCADDAGVVSCTCELGWTGGACNSCDESAGYHDDGAGGCTTDPCVPNPCNEANKSICTDSGGAAICACDAGFHDDGAEGCTDDPCTPHPCGDEASCTDVGGSAQCDPLDCDDQNPCTIDFGVAGVCQTQDHVDGKLCQTDQCLTGQSCTSGMCSGGTTITCDDANPCTADGCDSASGCTVTPDDGLVPDDGVACTDDSCVSGVATHVANDGTCDDGQYCSGVEACAPSDGGADGQGCVTSNVPSPPSDNDCVVWSSCDEASQGFVPTVMEGASCDDGATCTTDEVCNASGYCVGTPGPDCGALDCGTVTAWDGTVDLPKTKLTGAITFNGGPLPPTATTSESGIFYLRHQDTKALHNIGSYIYSWNGSAYAPTTDTIDTHVIAGTYDLVYRDNWNRDWNTTSLNDSTRPERIYGYATLQTDIVISGADQVLNVDLPTTKLTGAITFNGAPLPATATTSESGIFYLRHQDTKALHNVGSYIYSWNGSAYAPTSDTIDTHIIAGTYDLVYRDNWNRDWNTTALNDSTRPERVYGYATLQTGIVIGGSDQVLDVDLPKTRITGDITFNGAPLPATATTSESGIFYLRHQDTKALHNIGSYIYSWNGSAYAPTTDTIDTHIIAGTYDLVYRDNWNRDWNTTSLNDSTRPERVYGYATLQAGIVIGGTDQVLDVDLPKTKITGDITFNGAALPATATTSESGIFYLRHQDTKALHNIGSYIYSWNGSAYAPTTDTIDTHVIAGSYDLVYRDNWNRDWNTASLNDSTRPERVYGYATLQAGIVIGGTDQVLDVDLPKTKITGDITFNGAALPATATTSESGIFYLRHQDTKALHNIGSYIYSWNGSAYAPTTDTIDTHVIAGTYDLVYRDNWNRDWNTTSLNDPTRPERVYGYALLQTDIVISGADQALDVDLPVRGLAAEITFDGAPLPATATTSESGIFYLRHKDTGALHNVGSYIYSWNGSGYAPTTDAIDTHIIAGTYDLVYRDNWNRDWNTTALNDSTRPERIYGYTTLRQCILVPQL